MTPEQKTLADLVGTWDMAMTFGGEVTRGTTTFAPGVGGRWLESDAACVMFGQPFSGKGFESYDAAKGKYVSVWLDSMSDSPVVMEGVRDPATGEKHMAGTGPAMDRLPAAYRSVAVTPDADTMELTMYIGDGPEPAFTARYTRRK